MSTFHGLEMTRITGDHTGYIARVLTKHHRIVQVPINAMIVTAHIDKRSKFKRIKGGGYDIKKYGRS